jgi:two-component system, response regulator PdtaR
VRRVCHSAIPATKKKSSGLLAAGSKVVSMLEGLKVVVAEDEGLIRMDVVATLEEAGLVVVGQAADGEEAISLATEHEPDLVVMDVKMPKLDGISAAEKITALKIPVVLLTAFSDAELVSRAAEAGAMAYVTKPFKPTDLIPAIQIALSRHEELVALEQDIADLSERLETRKLMDRAKGLLQSKMKLSEPEAFRWIQKASMDRRLTMAQVAKTVIEQLGDK